ncbi:MAG: hypothetical protein PHI55_14025 [Burkholderiaceae bacterium]|nr:hypothetical protein [Burkholderiaceae bacterium]
MSTRAPLPMDSRSPKKVDYEYVRNGITNLVVAVEPKARQRIVSVTERRGQVDFVAFVCDLLTHVCQGSPRSSDSGQSEHPLQKMLGRRVGKTRSAQARDLAEHGGDRDWHPQSPVPGPVR